MRTKLTNLQDRCKRFLSKFFKPKQNNPIEREIVISIDIERVARAHQLREQQQSQRLEIIQEWLIDQFSYYQPEEVASIIACFRKFVEHKEYSSPELPLSHNSHYNKNDLTTIIYTACYHSLGRNVRRQTILLAMAIFPKQLSDSEEDSLYKKVGKPRSIPGLNSLEKAE